VGNSDLYTDGHVPPLVVRDVLPGNVWEAYFKFVFVRNPWDWFVSQYFYNRRKQGMHPGIDSRLSRQDIMDTYDHLRRYRGIAGAPSLYQYYYAYSWDGERLVDYIARYERLQEDFRVVLGRIGADCRLPHLNATPHRPYQEYYDEETRHLVGTLYALDIETFAYTFE
jgi:hypothetical protein